MIVIADSGSSKTDWRLITRDGISAEAQTSGLNPLIISEVDFKNILQKSDLIGWPADSIEKVYFYGAGITSIKLQENVAEWLKPIFKKAVITANSDLMAAARAVYGTEEGIIGILGTGSNSGYFNGSEIEKRIPPLGYMLGDEGSGNALGKQLVVAFLRDELPGTLAKEFNSFYPDYKNLLKDIYASSQPSRLLASFVPFIHQHQEDSFFRQFVQDEFVKYFRLVSKYENISRVGLVGSVAYYFSKTIHQVAEKAGIKIYKIIKSPIESLTLHHTQNYHE